MATAQMNDSWSDVKDRIRALWSEVEFEDGEMKNARGNLGLMIGLIHDKTGESRREIMQKMSTVL